MSTPQRIAELPTEESFESPWNKHSDQWHKIGPPLRPAAEDIGWFQHQVNEAAGSGASLNALLLGVTVEISGLSWPHNCELFAVDVSDAMLTRHWRSPQSIDALAVRGSWLHQPFETRRMHLALGDGSLSILADFTALKQAAEELARILAPGGRLLLRSFVRLERESTCAQVVDALYAGEIGNFHIFKWRLIMAMHARERHGVQLDSVYRAVQEAIPDRHTLAARLGWEPASIDTIDAYKGVEGQYFFPTLAQLREVLSSGFVEERCDRPGYELGERCPLTAFVRR